MNNNFWKNKKVFLTGHTGFKGTWLSVWLTSLGAKVYGYSLKPEQENSLFFLSGMDSKVSSTIGDIRDFDFLKRTLDEADPDIIIHMAAQPLVLASYEAPVDTYSTNVMGTVNLLEASRSCKNLRALLNVTTDKVYENKEWVWAYRENEPLGGYDPYSNSKACSELVTQAYRDSFFNINDYGKSHNVGVATARSGNVIGGGDWAENRLIPDFFRAHKIGSGLSLRNPNSIRPWQHVLEALRGYLILTENLYLNGAKYSQAWNFGPKASSYLNIGEIINYLVNDKKIQVNVNYDQESKVHEANLLKLDWAKSSELLGWFPKWDIQVTLNDIGDFYISSYRESFDAYSEMLKSINKYVETSR